MTYWTYTLVVYNGLKLNGTSATMSTSIDTYAQYRTANINVTSTLQVMNANGTWSSITPQSGSGTGACNFSRTVSLTRGRVYRVLTTGTVTYGGRSEQLYVPSQVYYP